MSEIDSFLEMRERAELKALSNTSLNRQLSEKEFIRFRELFDKYKEAKNELI